MPEFSYAKAYLSGSRGSDNFLDDVKNIVLKVIASLFALLLGFITNVLK